MCSAGIVGRTATVTSKSIKSLRGGVSRNMATAYCTVVHVCAPDHDFTVPAIARGVCFTIKSWVGKPVDVGAMALVHGQVGVSRNIASALAGGTFPGKSKHPGSVVPGALSEFCGGGRPAARAPSEDHYSCVGVVFGGLPGGCPAASSFGVSRNGSG